MKKLDYSQITEQLFVGVTPRRADYKKLKEQGITLVINMRVEWPAKYVRRQSDIKEVWVPSVDPRYIPLSNKRLLKGAKLGAKELEKGGKVYVYCRQGRHRSAAMAAVILRLRGFKTADLLRYMQEHRTVVDDRAVAWADKIVASG